MTAPTGPNRPRDALGRPLGADADPALVVASVPERTWVDSYESLAEAETYLADDRPFHAHEVLEQRWRCAPDPERPLWRALAQWAAAETHAARGNDRGARAVAARAAEGLRAYGGPAVRGVDPDGEPWVMDLAGVIAACARRAGDDAGAAPAGPVRLLRRGPNVQS